MADTLLLLYLLFLLANSVEVWTEDHSSQFTKRTVRRTDFPSDFVFGAGSSAYQYEGAAKVGGRGPSILDVYAHTPGQVKDGSSGDVADDQFHRYKSDVELMKDLNLDAYRLSISWTRLFPEGRGNQINQAGVDHYNRVFDTLLEKGLKPYVTLQHFDTPQALEESYGGMLSMQFVEDYAKYAEACFEAFGDRVKNWITLNEPHITAWFGYSTGILPPQRCSAAFGNCTIGNSSTEPYIVAHHCLLAHAAAVAIYRRRFQARQGGSIGITLYAKAYEPLQNSSKDIAAVQRAHDFEIGWFLDPIMFGKYPTSMQYLVAHRLPKFTKDQLRAVKGSIDFIGLNHYTTMYVKAVPKPTQPGQIGYPIDSQTLQTAYRDGVAIGPLVNGHNIVPRGMRILVNYVKARYGDIPIVITENGSFKLSNCLFVLFRISTGGSEDK